jgi:hypothetical protein
VSGDIGRLVVCCKWIRDLSGRLQLKFRMPCCGYVCPIEQNRAHGAVVYWSCASTVRVGCDVLAMTSQALSRCGLRLR